MINIAYQKLVHKLNDIAEPLSNNTTNYDSLLNRIGDARFVLIGEATHGSKEFYQTRAAITQQLIEKKGFTAVTIESDWMDAYRIHRYIHGTGPESGKHILENLTPFPMWMWRNTTFLPYIKWLRNYNKSTDNKISFYSLDLYSLHTSTQALIEYLYKVDPSAAERARAHYANCDLLKINPQMYGAPAALEVKRACVKVVTEQLMQLQHEVFNDILKAGIPDEDEDFYHIQNMRLDQEAETFFSSMFENHISAWNIREKHMAKTLNTVANHLENRDGQPAKIIVWAHNSHICDARATEVAEQGEINLGQLMREQYEKEAYLIGFSTYEGSVTAASNWGALPENKPLNPGFESSYEELFHHMRHKNFMLHLKENLTLEHLLQVPRLQRAIGVVYRPEAERHSSHYYFTRLPYEFDSMIHIDHTSAVQPLQA